MILPKIVSHLNRDIIRNSDLEEFHIKNTSLKVQSHPDMFIPNHAEIDNTAERYTHFTFFAAYVGTIQYSIYIYIDGSKINKHVFSYSYHPLSNAASILMQKCMPSSQLKSTFQINSESGNYIIYFDSQSVLHDL